MQTNKLGHWGSASNIAAMFNSSNLLKHSQEDYYFYLGLICLILVEELVMGMGP